MLTHQLFNWHLELTSKCTLRCSRCLRTEQAGKFIKTELSFELIKKVFTPTFLKENVHRITFSGGFGDPIYHSQLHEIVRYLKTSHPALSLILITNGSHRSAQWWEELVEPLTGSDEIIFSIDGWDQESNSHYRVGCDWSSMMVGLDIAVASRACVRWSTIIFKFNQDHLDHISDLAKQKKVDRLFFVKSERFGPRFHASNGDSDPLEPTINFKSSLFRSERLKQSFWPNAQKKQEQLSAARRFDIAYKKAREATENQFSQAHIMPTCLFGYRGAYIDVQGFYFPCSWISHPYESVQSLVDPQRRQSGSSGFLRYLDRLDLKSRELAVILSDPMWASFSNEWLKADTSDIICEKKCLNRADYRAGTISGEWRNLSQV